MEKAKVYFTDFHTIAFGDGLPTKLKKLPSLTVIKTKYRCNAHFIGVLRRYLFVLIYRLFIFLYSFFVFPAFCSL